MEITEKAPAKINLGLDVIGKREDGYHDLAMIMSSVDLSDRITVTELDDDAIVIDSDSPFVPKNKKNHAYQAAYQIKQRYGITKGVKIYIEKRTPVAAGLAGGSSDAAATLRALNKLWDLQLDLPTLAEIGEAIGSDVPYCVYGGTARVTGRGEFVEPIADAPRCWVILVKPAFGVSTPEVFKQVNLETIDHVNIDGIATAVNAGDYQGVLNNLGNSLEAITIAKHPEVARIKDKLASAGADGVLMSGSGPTVFALCKQDKQAQRVYNAMKGFCKEVYMVRML
jgi:4-diphosphocytidyl-2-C-methyl-D-erythritol kinase/energy-coupling factor transport system substrate-specific component